MKLRVSLGAKTFDIDASGLTKVEELQDRVAEASGVHARNQRLIFKGKNLAATDPLSATGLRDGSKMMLVASSGTAGAATAGAAAVVKRREERVAEARKRVESSRAAGGAAIPAAAPATWTERARGWRGTGVVALSGSGLQAVPPEALAEPLWASARFFDASDNSLAALPGEVGRLTGLTRLNLSGNRLPFEGVPWEALAQLPSLTVLSLAANALAGPVPAGSLGALSALEKLSLRGNRITDVPAGTLPGVPRLRVLDVAENELNALPEDVGVLSDLAELSLDGNRLAVLPEGLCRLRKLQVLSANANRISARGIPAGLLGGCEALTVLRLHDNGVTLEELRGVEGWASFDERRRGRYSKVIEGNAMLGGFDEGASSTLFDHWGR